VIRSAGLAVLVPLVAGCATGPFTETGTFLPPKHQRALQAAPLCCKSYRDIRFTALQPNVQTKHALTPHAPVFEFEGRRSFFAAFELAAPEGQLRVTTKPVNMLWNLTGHVLVPKVDFLNRDHEVIATAQPSYETKLEFQRGAWAEARIAIPEAARYAIVRANWTADGLEWRDPEQPAGFFFVRSGPTGEVGVTPLPRRPTNPP
jgi:hypothetical protein